MQSRIDLLQLNVSMSHKNTNRVAQFFIYQLGGILFFAGGYATFFVCDKVFHLNLFASKQIANLVGLSLNYVVQRYLAFAGDLRRAREAGVMGRYAFVTIMNFGIDYIIIASLKSVGVSPYLGQFVSAGFFTPWNYVWYRYVVFKESTHGKRRGRR